ncbi:MAG: hypothetical protein LQ338_002415 [Usnochroma carphineum]|nr:MAG: hypothetical protein LQ338_002415 [Usnochroma carphineum]
MDHAAFHIVYVDKRVSANLDGKYLHNAVRDSPAEKGLAFRTDQQLNCFQLISSEMGLVRDNLSNLLSSFRGVHICTSGDSCMTKLSELESNEISLQPTLVILEGTMALAAIQPGNEIPNHYRQSRSDVHPRTSHSMPPSASQNAAVYDTNLLRSISSHIARSKLSSLIVLLAFIELSADAPDADHGQSPSKEKPLVPQEMLRYRIRSIASHAYRVRLEKSKQKALYQEGKKARKRSWVGMDDRKPVSGLMTGICSPEEVQPTISSHSVNGDLDEDPSLIRAFTSWSFSAHEFNEDQLVHAAFLMLQHALSLPELEQWRISAG